MTLEATIATIVEQAVAKALAGLPASGSTDPYRVYGPDEVAARLGISRRSLAYLREQYPDYFVRVGRSWCLTHNQLSRFFADLEAGLISLDGIANTAQSGTTR